MEKNNSNGSPSSPSKPFYEARDYDLQFPTWSLEYLKSAAIQQKLVRPRSLAWAILLNAVPSPCGDILMSIRGHRNFYEDLKKKLSMDPRAVIGDDPLSQNDESVWKQHFCDNELKALILQDVVRTFPDEAYFRDKDVQDMMVRVLFFWARAHPSPGYRQGMHEILAPALAELHADRRCAPPVLSDTLRYYLQEEYLEHDSYMLFSAIMKGLEKFYSTGDVIPNTCGRLPTSKTTHNQNEVVRYLDRLREQYLAPADPELCAHLADCSISLELFGIRWLRLLFGREFPRSDIPQLWGFIFSDGPMLPNLHYVVLAMLLPIRDMLLESDAGAALSLLMRPSSVSVGHVCALALHLRSPLDHPKPPPPHLVSDAQESVVDASSSVWSGGLEQRAREEAEEEAQWSGLEGVAEGGDVARSLAALALLRARLPPAAAALHAALPRPPPLARAPLQQIVQVCDSSGSEQRAREEAEEEAQWSGSEGVAEGGDVARSLAALALLRARLPPAAAALHAALPRPPPLARAPLQQIVQLAALLQCRNHALIDVETALEAAENQSTDAIGRRQLLPVVMLPTKKNQTQQTMAQKQKQVRKVKEVPLTVFHQAECVSASDLPCLDPLRLRTE